VRANPNAAVASFSAMCASIASWRRVDPPELHAEMLQLLQGLKQVCGK
jgi:hypothetical protein